jgi:hypothetical protein
VSVSRSIFALIDDRDRAYFGRDNQETDQAGYIDAQTMCNALGRDRLQDRAWSFTRTCDPDTVF